MTNKRHQRLFIVMMMVLALLFTVEWKTAYASSNIQSLLTSWFEGKQQESIQSLEEEIMIEKEAQMSVLKEEIAVSLNQANKELADLSKEADKSKQELKSYTEQLIQTIEFNEDSKRDQFISELEKIMEEAYMKLEQAGENALYQSE
jgi:predicted transcriptional regulator